MARYEGIKWAVETTQLQRGGKVVCVYSLEIDCSIFRVCFLTTMACRHKYI